MDIDYKIKAYQEIKGLLKDLSQQLIQKNWDIACDTCNSRDLIIHGVDLFPNVIYFYCLHCSMAGSVKGADRRKIAKFVKQYVKLKDTPRFAFKIQRHAPPKRNPPPGDSSSGG